MDAYTCDVVCYLLYILLGRGVRCLTARNKPTWPASVPQYRHAPDTERFLKGTRPTPGPCSTVAVPRYGSGVFNGSRDNDEKALVRHVHQMKYQTSGEYGGYLFNTESAAVKYNKGVMNARPSEKEVNSARTESTGRLTGRDSNPITGRSHQSGSISQRSSGNGGAHSSHRTQNECTIASALNDLDSAFSRKNRRDLFVASLPKTSDHELILSATSGNLAQLQSKPWADKLR